MTVTSSPTSGARSPSSVAAGRAAPAGRAGLGPGGGRQRSQRQHQRGQRGCYRVPHGRSSIMDAHVLLARAPAGNPRSQATHESDLSYPRFAASSVTAPDAASTWSLDLPDGNTSCSSRKDLFHAAATRCTLRPSTWAAHGSAGSSLLPFTISLRCP